MSILTRTLRTLAVAAVLVCIGIAGLFVLAAHFAERFLDGERSLGGAVLQVHAPDVSPWMTFRADSLTVRSDGVRVRVTRPAARLADWSPLHPGSFSLLLRADSIRVVVDSTGPERSKDAPVSVPVVMRFPVPARLEWRALELVAPGMPALRAGAARWSSQGSHALEGDFCLDLPASAEGGTPECVPARAEASWFRPLMRYRVEVDGGAELGFRVSGVRAVEDLASGFDSVAFHVARFDGWTDSGAPALAIPRDLRVEGRLDWRADTVRLDASWSLPPVPPMEAMDWQATVRANGAAGWLALQGRGTRQAVDARGEFRHPERWTAGLPDWHEVTGELSGEVRGGDWRIVDWDLPLDFDVLQARLERGGNVSALLRTRDASRVDARWSAARPGRLELQADISPSEAWAVAWTNGNIGWRDAHAQGAWEDGKLRVVAHVREPRAYGASGDSLTADNEVTSSGYFLRRGIVHRDGATYTGSGRVLWKDPAAPEAVTLRFDAANPAHGRAEIVMRVPGSFTVKAESVYVSRTPYDALRIFADIDPRVHGTFTWDPGAGNGNARVATRLWRSGEPVDAAAELAWRPDSLQVRNLRLEASGGLLEAEGMLPFDGRSLRVTDGIGGLSEGTWAVSAHSVRMSAAALVAGIRDTMPWRGVLSGSVRHAPATGLRGTASWDDIPLPWAGRVAGLRLTGLGDSILLEARAESGGSGTEPDTAFAMIRNLRGDVPDVRAEGSSGGFRMELQGILPGWENLRGTVRATGRQALPAPWGALEEIRLEGELVVPLRPEAVRSATFRAANLTLLHRHANDSLQVEARPELVGGVLKASWEARHGDDMASGGLEAGFDGRLEIHGSAQRFSWTLPSSERFDLRDATATFTRDPRGGMDATLVARSGNVLASTAPLRLETGFEQLDARAHVPPPSAATPPKLALSVRLQDFFLQRRWGMRDATAFFAGLGRPASRPAQAGPARAWELDVNLEATGARNRIDTDVLRMNFIGDARVTGMHPYLLVNGKLTGMQGEVGQPGQSYTLRDFEVRWDNVAAEDGLLTVEGDTRLRADCRPDTRQTCQVAVRLDGRLEEVGFTYETDCGQITGDPVAPAVIISSVAQGCFAAETQGSEGSYGAAAFAMLEPALNQRLTREVSRGSAGFIKSTQVSGLSALLGSDSTGLESVSLEVESRSVHRVGFKGRAGYHPETKLANPMEYRLAAEYRPPLERIWSDSTWQARVRGRVTVEAAVETRPEGRDLEEERRVRQRAGLRYRYRFWDLW